jgi:hypothetical protein
MFGQKARAVFNRHDASEDADTRALALIERGCGVGRERNLQVSHRYEA